MPQTVQAGFRSDHMGGYRVGVVPITTVFTASGRWTFNLINDRKPDCGGTRCYRVIYDDAAFNELQPFRRLVFGMCQETARRKGSVATCVEIRKARRTIARDYDARLCGNVFNQPNAIVALDRQCTGLFARF